MPSSSNLSLGFIICGVVNMGIVHASRFFSDNLGQVDPMFDSFGCVMIVLWGLAYLASARVHRLVPELSLVFAAEKFIYAERWIRWLVDNYPEGAEVVRDAHGDAVANFFTIYGLPDAISMIFFLYAAWSSRENLFRPLIKEKAS